MTPSHNFESRKALGLLCYLVVQKQPVPRSYLADLFWPDKTEARGRGNLSRVLHNISTLLPGCLEANRHHVQFQPAQILQIDIDIFDELVSLGDAESLAAAAELYRGEFMSGFYLDDCPEVETWLVTERTHWSQRIARVLRRLVTYHTQHHQYERGLEFARRHLALDPWREEVHRQVMTLLAFRGQRSAALAQYEACRRILAEELSIEPGPETTALYERIRQGKLDRPAKRAENGDSLTEAVPPVATPPPFSPALARSSSSSVPFVNRKQELKQLADFLDLALVGQGQVAFITGEAGSGKTALIQEFARRAQQEQADLMVAGGQCNAYRGLGTPYLPFREILEMLTGDIEARWATETLSHEAANRLWYIMPHVIQALVNVGPDLIDVFVSGSTLKARAALAAPREAGWFRALQELMARRQSGSGPNKLQQHDLFEQYTRVLQTLSQRHPLLLVLDDLQWAGVGSASLLFHLGRRLNGSPILIVGAYRPADVALGHPPAGSGQEEQERHPLAAVVNEFQRHFGQIFINLDRATGREFLEAFLDSEPNRLDDQFRQALYEHTRGQPLFTVETTRRMQERGVLVKDEAGRWVAGPAVDWSTLPARVEGVIGERIDRLPAALRELLEVASVEGEEFTAEVISQVQALEARELIRQLSSRLDQQHRLVRSQGSRQLGQQRLSSYRFRHILYQKYLYDNLDQAQRIYLHEAVGKSLERLYGDQVEEIAGELARHFQAAGLIAQAVAYLRQAGEKAVRLFANDEAIAHFTQSLTLLGTLPDTSDRARQELSLQLALSTPLVMGKGYAAPEVEQCYVRARALCRQLGEPPQPLAPVLRGLWNCYLVRAEHRRAHKLAEQFLALAERSRNVVLLMEAHWMMGETLFSLGDLVGARTHQDQTIALYDQKQYRAYVFGAVQDPGLSSRYFNAVTLWLLGYPDQALKQIKGTLALARKLADPFDLASTLFFAAILRQFCRESQMVQTYAEEVLALAANYSFVLPSAWGAILRGWALTNQGYGQAGVDQLRHGLANFQATEAGAGQPHYLALLAEAYGQIGQIENGLAALQEAQALVSESGESWREAELHRLQGELLIQALDQKRPPPNTLAEIEACFDRALQLARRQQTKSLELRAAISLYRWRQTLGVQEKSEEARQLLAELYSWFIEGFDTADLQEARALLESFS